MNILLFHLVPATAPIDFCLSKLAPINRQTWSRTHAKKNGLAVTVKKRGLIPKSLRSRKSSNYIMSQNLVLVENQGVYIDYESVQASINWCTPSFMGFSICVDASAAGGIVTLKLTLNSPFGSYTKTFNFNSNVCFDWKLPIKLGPSIEICITNLRTSPNVSFTLSLALCLTLPIVGKKCVKWTHTFNLPFMSEQLLSAENAKPEDLTTLYVLLAHSAGEGADAPCNCH